MSQETTPDTNVNPVTPARDADLLFPLLTLYTVVYMVLMILDFALTAFTLPGGLMPLYIALTGAYAADKEIKRWLGFAQSSRRGAGFVYAWILLYLVEFCVHCVRKDMAISPDLLPMALEVLAIFFGSRASKRIWEAKSKSGAGGTTPRHEAILALFQPGAQVSRRTVATALGVSDATALRLLSDLEALGTIRRVGEGRAAHYEIVSSQ